ncbi:hypothetical protein [Streptococcus pneumoniae]|nr:hypothetical protein [Streptococcus pneumoniae]
MKLTKSASKYCFEVADRTDEVRSKHCFEVVEKLTKSVTSIRQGEADLV